MKYIDRDLAIEMITNDAPDLVYYNKEEAIDCLECVPTVWKCSECGHLTGERIFRDINGIRYRSENPFYCSRCGAKMGL